MCICIITWMPVVQATVPFASAGNTDACIQTRESTWALCFKSLKTVRRGLAYLQELSLSQTKPLFTLCMDQLHIPGWDS